MIDTWALQLISRFFKYLGSEALQFLEDIYIMPFGRWIKKHDNKDQELSTGVALWVVNPVVCWAPVGFGTYYGYIVVRALLEVPLFFRVINIY